MPLSDHEARQLEQIEQSLYADHPRLARVMRARDPKVHFRRRVMRACAGFVIGAAAVAGGLVLGYTWLLAAGLAVMVAAGVLAVLSYRRMASVLLPHRRQRRERSRAQAASAGSHSAGSGLMERIEERWRRRQEGNRGR